MGVVHEHDTVVERGRDPRAPETELRRTLSVDHNHAFALTEFAIGKREFNLIRAVDLPEQLERRACKRC